MQLKWMPHKYIEQITGGFCQKNNRIWTWNCNSFLSVLLLTWDVFSNVSFLLHYFLDYQPLSAAYTWYNKHICYFLFIYIIYASQIYVLFSPSGLGRVLTLVMSVSQSFFTAVWSGTWPWRLQWKYVLLSSIFFIADSVVRGNLMMA